MNENQLRIKQLVVFHDPSVTSLKNDPRPNLYKSAMLNYSGLDCTITRIIHDRDENYVWAGIIFDDGTEFNVYPEWLSSSGIQTSSKALTVDKIKELLYDLERTVGRDKRRDLIDKFVQDFNS